MAGVYEWVQSLNGAWPELLGAMAGSFLGLLSLLAGALYNARLNRMAERHREQNDRFGIVEALIAEISSVQHTLVKAAQELREDFGDKDQVFIPDPCPDRGIFDAFLSRIELFNEDIIRSVSDLYTVLGEYCSQVVVRGGAFDSSIKGRGLLIVKNHLSESVAAMNDDVSRRCSDVLSDLRFQRICTRHAVTRW